jgi:hypothetical protein
MTVELVAIIFVVLTGIVILFQVCLALGVPWGSASMGGKFPGKYPPEIKVVALINALILGLITMIVLSRSGMIFTGLMPFSQIAVWVVVVFFTLGTVMNTITPSKIERIWAPVALTQMVTSIIIALS